MSVERCNRHKVVSSCQEGVRELCWMGAVDGFNGSAWELPLGEHDNATIFLRPHDEAAQSLALQRLKVATFSYMLAFFCLHA